MRGCRQTVPGDASCASPELSQGGGFMMWAVGLPVLGVFGEFWVHPRYLHPKYLWGPISLHGINLKILNKLTNPVSIWGKIYPSFWLGVRQTFSHMHSGDSLWGCGVTRQVREHFMIIGKSKPVHQSLVLLSFSIQGPNL